MKYILTFIVNLFFFTTYGQSFLYSFNSNTQVINGDSLYVEARVEVSDKEIRIWRDTIMTMNFKVNLKKVEGKYLDIEKIDYRAGFDPEKKILYIQNKHLLWQIIGN